MPDDTLSSINTDIYLRRHQRFCFHEISKASPCIAFTLAPVVQPVEQELPYVEVELLQADIIIRYAIIMVISDEHFIQLFDKLVCRDISVCPYISPHLLTLLPAGFPLYPELTAPIYRAIMHKTQKVKCCGFSFLFRSILLGESPKLDHPAFVLL